jgi:hypothetical protein
MYFDLLRYPAIADGERTEAPETGEPFEGNEIGWIDPGSERFAGRGF